MPATSRSGELLPRRSRAGRGLQEGPECKDPREVGDLGISMSIELGPRAATKSRKSLGWFYIHK